MARKNICLVSYSALVSVISIKLSELKGMFLIQFKDENCVKFWLKRKNLEKFFKLAIELAKKGSKARQIF